MRKTTVNNYHYSIIYSKVYKCLALLRRMYGKFRSVEAKRSLYLALVRSQLSYCSQLWNPHLIKGTTTLERVHRHAKKYILDDYSSDYKQRLLNLQLLPLMYTLDYYDILFFVKSLKQPSNHFNILTLSKNRRRSATHYYTITHLITKFVILTLTISLDCGMPSLLLTQICTSIQSKH